MEELEQRGYTNLRHFATGGEGNIYLCEKQGVTYVVKVIALLEPEQIDILKSINALKSEYFPKIEQIFDSGENTVIVREYIEGTTLSDELKKNESYSYKRAKEIIFDVCNALRTLHTMKPHPVIYRDLKPENIIITVCGDVRLIDFGIARYYKQEAVRDTVLAGTIGYTAPEVMAGMQSDERSDIYSVGLLFYEMLSGKSLQDPPYQVRPIAENSEYLPAYIDEIIARATDLDQTNRYASIDELVYEIESIKEIRAARKRKKRRRRMMIAASVLIVLSAATVFLVPVFFGEKAETLLELNFDDENDLYYISNGIMDSGNRFEIKDGALHMIREGCNLQYMPRNGMLVHFRMKTSGCGAIELNHFRINNSLGFECLYHDDEQDTEMTTWDLPLSGMPVVNAGQWLDCILYTNEPGSAVYAVICDNESKNIAYTAYQIPKVVNENPNSINNNGNLSVTIMPFFEKDSDLMIIDSIHIAEGSLKEYLKTNMEAYAAHRSKADAFLSQDVSTLPEMVFKPADQWQG